MIRLISPAWIPFQDFQSKNVVIFIETNAWTAFQFSLGEKKHESTWGQIQTYLQIGLFPLLILEKNVAIYMDN